MARAAGANVPSLGRVIIQHVGPRSMWLGHIAPGSFRRGPGPVTVVTLPRCHIQCHAGGSAAELRCRHWRPPSVTGRDCPAAQHPCAGSAGPGPAGRRRTAGRKVQTGTTRTVTRDGAGRGMPRRVRQSAGQSTCPSPSRRPRHSGGALAPPPDSYPTWKTRRPDRQTAGDDQAPTSRARAV